MTVQAILVTCPNCTKWVKATSKGNTPSHCPSPRHPEALRRDGKCLGSGKAGKPTR